MRTLTITHTALTHTTLLRETDLCDARAPTLQSLQRGQRQRSRELRGETRTAHASVLTAHALVGGTAAVGASPVRWDGGGALLLQDAKEVVDLERAVLGQVCAVHGVVDLVLAEARAEGVGLQV